MSNDEFLDFCNSYGKDLNFLTTENNVNILLDLLAFAEYDEKWDIVNRIASRVIELDVDNVEALFFKGKALFNLEIQEDISLECYDKVISSKQDFVDLALWGKCMIYYSQKKFQNALEECDKATELKPSWGDLWMLKSIILLEMNSLKESEKCFEKALELGTNNANLWADRGDALNHIGQHQEAIKCYNKAMELNLNNPDLLECMAEAFKKLGHADEAKRCFEKAKELR